MQMLDEIYTYDAQRVHNVDPINAQISLMNAYTLWGEIKHTEIGRKKWIGFSKGEAKTKWRFSGSKQQD